MRAIETLLGIVDLKRADGLALVLGEVPTLLASGGRIPLTMPALSPDMMEHLLGELFEPAQRAALRETGVVASSYRSSAYGVFAVQARASDDQVALTVKRSLRNAATDQHAAVNAQKATLSAPESIPSTRAANIDGVASACSQLNEAPAAGPLDAILEEALMRRASDVIVSSERAPLMRIDGELITCHDAVPRSSSTIEAYVMSQLGTEQQRTFKATGSVDLAVQHRDAHGVRSRFRANVFRHESGVALVLRPIVAEIPTLSELSLPYSLTQLVEQRTGLLLFTGPTGSGKSTTLAALLEHVNRTRAAHIVTLEDPIEYLFRPHRSVFHQREIGEHVSDFATGLRAALRENPDVLLLGEMRDPETIRMALTAAQTGHLVLSTIHSGTAVMAIERIIDAFPEAQKSHVRQELATSLRHIVAQQLVPASDGGRVPALEVLTVNHAVASQIRDGRTHLIATQLETGAEDGMVPMARSLANLVKTGRVTRTVALAACDQREALERLLDGVTSRSQHGPRAAK